LKGSDESFKVAGTGIFTLEQDIYKKFSAEEIRQKIKDVSDERILVIAEAIRRGVTVEEINNVTKIDLFFLNKSKSGPYGRKVKNHEAFGF